LVRTPKRSAIISKQEAILAATAVYVNINRIPYGSLPDDAKSFSNIGATTAAFRLDGGKYNVDVIASTFGTVTLQRLGPDGSTYLTAMTAFAANGLAVADLPKGLYKVALA
jgi:hypothetical protein